MKVIRSYRGGGYWRGGDVFIWMSAGATTLALILILGVLYLVAAGGLGFFWPSPIERLELKDGSIVMGQRRGQEKMPAGSGAREGERRVRVKAANRQLYGEREYVWVRESEIVARSRPPDAVLLERSEYGDFIGWIDAYRRNGTVLARGEDAVGMLRARLGDLARLRDRIRDVERDDVGAINAAIERRRLLIGRIRLDGGEPARAQARIAEIQSEIAALHDRYEGVGVRIDALRDSLGAETLDVRTADGRETTLAAGAVYRLIQPNAIGLPGKLRVYASRVWSFVSESPREANLEGGIFPAIFGTVLMTLLMTLIVVPLGAVAGIYLREYAKQGPLVRAVRIAVNNLAGVPSIVFGVFGLGFFIYFVGGAIDRRFFPEALPSPTFGTGGILWSAFTLALLTVPVVIVATEEGLAAVPRAVREGSLALGASKWETTWRVVLPAASPGLLTGVILAIARAAGEVAPLMLTGAVKTANELPLDGVAPFLHLERKFMHLGFHIYDVGFQSPNVEAAKPMVYMTTLLLVVIVVLLNVLAMWIRGTLRARYRSASF
jgi:phosphate transport system permease protein